MSLESGDDTKLVLLDSGLDNKDNLNDENIVYYIITNDKTFNLTENAIMMSELAKTALNGDTSTREIRISNVKSHIMAIIVKYLNYHCENPVPENNTPDKLRTNNFSENIKCEWDVNFIENDVMSNPETAKQNLYDLINAANYMCIESLLNLSITKIATMISNKPLAEIKNILDTNVSYKGTNPA